MTDFPDPRRQIRIDMHVPERPFPHGLHAALTLFSFGCWLPVWVLHYLFTR